jgi:hypothetical protein
MDKSIDFPVNAGIFQTLKTHENRTFTQTLAQMSVNIPAPWGPWGQWGPLEHVGIVSCFTLEKVLRSC